MGGSRDAKRGERCERVCAIFSTVVIIFGLCMDCRAVLSFWLYISIEQLCCGANFCAVYVNFESSYACLS